MELGRFSEVGLLIMIGLSEGPKHGYALIDEVERLRGRRPGPGTLYGAIGRLEEQGLIEPMPSTDRKTPYRLTRAGTKALTAELVSLELLMETAMSRLAPT
jgi:DNA-binding PadR family transcriptional regulator